MMHWTRLGFEVQRPGGTLYIFPKALEPDAAAFAAKRGNLTCCWCPATVLACRAMCAWPTASILDKVRRSLPALEQLANAYR